MGPMGPSSHRATAPAVPLPDDLTRAIQRAGYYPALVADVVRAALGHEEVVSHLVHQETTFDHDVVRRHSGAGWTVAFAGFAPGFAYLSGGDPRLEVPRMERPRPRVEA